MPATQVKLNQLKQASATTGQVISWDGTGWTPTTLSSGGTSSGTSGTIQYSNGSGGFSGDPSNLFWNSTTKSLQITGTSSAYAGVFSGDGGGINISQATNLTTTYTGVNISGNNTQNIRAQITNTNNASATSHASLRLGAALGDPFIIFSPTANEAGAVVAGIDNSSGTDVFYISRGSTPSALTGPQFMLDGASDAITIATSTNASYFNAIGDTLNIVGSELINMSGGISDMSMDDFGISVGAPIFAVAANQSIFTLPTGSTTFDVSFFNATQAILVSESTGTTKLSSRDASKTITLSNTLVAVQSSTGLTLRNSAGTGDVSLVSPSGTFNTSFTLPSSAGANGQALITDGSGTLSWGDVGGTSVITPTELTADQNNYGPTGFSTATIVRISGDNQLRVITGLVAPTSGTSFRQVTFVNVGSNSILFTSQDTSSTDVNRFEIDQKLFGLCPDDSVTFMYDNTTDRWRIINTTQTSYNRRQRFLNRDQLNPTTVYQWANTNSGGNVQSGVSGSGSLLEYTALSYISCGTTSTSYGTFYSAIQVFRSILSASNRIPNSAVFTTTLRIDGSLSDASNRYYIRLGLFNSTSGPTIATPVGMYFTYTDNENSGKIVFRIRNSGGSVTEIETVTPVASTYYKLEMVILPTREIMVYVDDVFYGKAANTNITNTTFYLGGGITKTVGTSNRGYYLDRFSMLTILP